LSIWLLRVVVVLALLIQETLVAVEVRVVYLLDMPVSI
jgi:hypothetical protein